MTPQWSEGKGENRDFGIYRSTSGIPANQAGSPVATTRPGPMKNEHVTFKGTTNRSPLQQEWTRWRLQEEKCLDMVTWERNMSKRKSVFFSSKKGLRGLEKI